MIGGNVRFELARLLELVKIEDLFVGLCDVAAPGENGIEVALERAHLIFAKPEHFGEVGQVIAGPGLLVGLMVVVYHK